MNNNVEDEKSRIFLLLSPIPFNKVISDEIQKFIFLKKNDDLDNITKILEDDHRNVIIIDPFAFIDNDVIDISRDSFENVYNSIRSLKKYRLTVITVEIDNPKLISEWENKFSICPDCFRSFSKLENSCDLNHKFLKRDLVNRTSEIINKKIEFCTLIIKAINGKVEFLRINPFSENNEIDNISVFFIDELLKKIGRKK